MSRSEQYIGLNEWASEFVQGEQVEQYTETIHRTYPSGEKVVLGPRAVIGSNVRMETHDSIEGAFGGSYPLFMYTFDDGREFYEFVQAEPWSSGPCYFLALRDGNGDVLEESKWTDEELDNA